MLEKIKQEKGFILLTSYLLMAALSVFSIALFSRGTSFLQSAERNKKRMVAFNAAEAGFDDAYYRLKNSLIASYPWQSNYTSLNSGSVRGGYSTTVTDMGNNVLRIQVTGYSPAASSTTESVESRSLTGYMQKASNAAFTYGVFAKDSIEMTGNAAVDAYNSAVGTYATTVSNDSTVATDSTSNGTVSLTGNTIVNGDVISGYGSTPSSVISLTGNALITGSSSAASAVFNPPAASTSIPSSGALSISGNTNYSLAAGTYHFSSLSIAGNGRLTATGAVTIYVSGSIAIAGNGISTSSSKPPNMLIYATGTSSVALSGNGNIYAGIYAPNSAVSNTGNGELYGAVVAKTYRQTGNGNVHFDKALEDVGGSSTTSTILSWKESGLVNSNSSYS